MKKKIKKALRIVVIGGGSGTSRILSGLKKYPVKISAIVSTADDGSSSGTLRKEFNMVPPGDMRQCLVALADNKKLAGYFHARFGKGNFYGHPLGNLVIALLYQHHGNIQKAVDEACDLLEIREHEVLPASLQHTTLVATLADKTKIIGEARITPSKCLQKKEARFSLGPRTAAANPRACEALKHADAIIVGPGNLFASILPALLPREIQQAFASSKAKKIFIANLMTQKGHTEDFSPGDFLRAIEAHAGKADFDAIFYNTTRIPKTFWHKNIGFEPVVARTEEFHDARFIPGKFAKTIAQERRGDPIASLRSLVVHDERAIAEKIFSYLAQSYGNAAPQRRK